MSKYCVPRTFIEKKNAVTGDTVKVEKVLFSKSAFNGRNDLYDFCKASALSFFMSENGAFFVQDEDFENEVHCLGIIFENVKEFLADKMIQAGNKVD